MFSTSCVCSYSPCTLSHGLDEQITQMRTLSAGFCIRPGHVFLLFSPSRGIAAGLSIKPSQLAYRVFSYDFRLPA
jgi:hypothetical protein